MKSVIYLCLQGVWGFGFNYNISRIINFGDSMSDTGNYYKLSGNTVPSSYLYYKGRFSDQLVWTESLGYRLNIYTLSYAYAYATADSSIFEVSEKVLEKKKIPGCIQQVNRFLEEHPYEELGGINHMATFAFTGVDYAHKKADGPDSADSMGECIEKLVQEKKMGHVIIITNFPYHLLPAFHHLDSKQQNVTAKYYKEKEAAMDEVIANLKHEYPHTKFHTLDLGELLGDLKAGRSHLNGNRVMLTDEPCLKGSYDRNGDFSPYTYNNKIGKRIFYDPSHVTATVHAFIANTAEKLIAASLGYQ